MINYPHGGDLYGEEQRPEETGAAEVPRRFPGNGIRCDFSVNINPLGMPEAARAEAIRGVELSSQYPDPHTRDLLRNAAAVYHLPEKWILAGNGAAELLFALIRVLQKDVVTVGPTFAGYREAAEAAKVSYREVLLREEDGFQLTEKTAEALLSCRDHVIVLCNPNNPTGRLIPRSILEMLWQETARRGQWLIVDESFFPLSEGEETDSMSRSKENLQPGHPELHEEKADAAEAMEQAGHDESMSLLTCLTAHPGSIVLRSLTKQFAMPGLRLGLMFTAGSGLILETRKQLQPWNVSLPAQLAGAAALQDEEYRRRTVPAIRIFREMLTAGLYASGGDKIRIYPSDTCYLLFHADPELTLPERLRGRGILIRDCANFSGLGSGWYRTAVKTPEENRKLLEEISGIVQGLFDFI